MSREQPELQVLAKSLFINCKPFAKISEYCSIQQDQILALLAQTNINESDLKVFRRKFKRIYRKSIRRNTNQPKGAFVEKYTPILVNALRVFLNHGLVSYVSELMQYLVEIVELYDWERNQEALLSLHEVFRGHRDLASHFINQIPKPLIKTLSIPNGTLNDSVISHQLEHAQNIVESLRARIRQSESVFRIEKEKGFHLLKETCEEAIDKLELVLTGVDMAGEMRGSQDISAMNEQVQSIHERDSVILAQQYEIENMSQTTQNLITENQDLHDLIKGLRRQLAQQDQTDQLDKPPEAETMRFVVNSSSMVYEYNPFTNNLHSVHVEGLQTGNDFASVKLPRGDLFICGGELPETNCIISPENALLIIPSMQYPRQGHCLVYYQMQVFVFGGVWEGQRVIPCEKYDLSMNKWTSISDLPKELCRASGFLIKNEIYLAGDADTCANNYTILKYSPDLDKFTETLMSIPGIKWGLLLFSSGNSLYIFQRELAIQYNLQSQ